MEERKGGREEGEAEGGGKAVTWEPICVCAELSPSKVFVLFGRLWK